MKYKAFTNVRIMTLSRLKVQKHYEILDALLNELPYLFWKDRNGIYQGGNLNQATNLGFKSPLDFIGKTIFEILADASAAKKIDDIDNSVMKNNLTIVIEEAITSGDTTHFYLSQKSPIRDEDNQVIGMIGFAIDITELKKAQEKSNAEISKLKKAIMDEKMQVMKTLAATMAHESRTPLATINAQSGFVKAILPTLLSAYEHAVATGHVQPLSTPQVEALRELPSEMNRATINANTFINMLLAKVNFDGGNDNSRPLTLLSAKDSLIEAIRLYPLDELSTAMIKTDYSGSFEFMGDDILFRHVIFNLLKNAIFYVRSKAEGGEIQIWIEQQADWNIIHFKDTGLGISSEVLPHIFNSFYTRTHHGTGVGLAFCKMIMEGFGGTISCQSVEGQYTHFILSFPKIKQK
jgi:PAS domain S-box-containing protein